MTTSGVLVKKPVDWDDVPAFLKLPGYVPPRKNKHGLTIADVPAWLHDGAGFFSRRDIHGLESRQCAEINTARLSGASRSFHKPENKPGPYVGQRTDGAGSHV
jgi:hypothetical protein